MPQLYLPAEHTDADLILAGLVAQRVDSAELYVAWTPEHGRATPEIAAELREPSVGIGGTLTLLLGALIEFCAALFGRVPAQPPVPAAAPPADAASQQSRGAA
jgi:hypothetical protein